MITEKNPLYICIMISVIHFCFSTNKENQDDEEKDRNEGEEDEDVDKEKEEDKDVVENGDDDIDDSEDTGALSPITEDEQNGNVRFMSLSLTYIFKKIY